MRDDLQMKKGLMVSFPCARGRAFVCKNIGDYIQSVAARQFVEDYDEYVQQEEASNYYPDDGKKIKLIMNGWFQWRAENWPPSDYVYPLLISMHISPLKEKEILTEAGINFLKKNGPVGCRDIGTKKMLEKVNVPCYFSGCLTLTLADKYYVPKENRENVYFVDPFFEVPELTAKLFISTGWYYLTHMKAINSLAKHDFFRDYLPTGFIDRNQKWYRAFYKATLFYKLYSKKFSKKLLLDAEYVTHWIDVDMKKDNDDKMMEVAEELVKKYASAKLVVTSRIHAGLPALGLETPVIFISEKKILSEKWEFNTPGRLDGVLDFFRILSVENGKFVTNDEELEKISLVDSDTEFVNKDDWRVYGEELRNKCKKFMGDERN